MSVEITANYGKGVSHIDVDYIRPGLACCYLVEQDGAYAFIDTGTSLAVPRILKVLKERGIKRKQVKYVIPTHVHLDHAGGSGLLMREFPKAKLVVHPRGARHMIDPSKLIAGSTAVYGEAGMAAHFGEIVPIPEERVIQAADQMVIDLKGRELLIIDTPGHALHHFCVWDAKSRGMFTGDTFGLSYREFDSPKGVFVIPPSTPVQFDPDAWHDSIDRLMAYEPHCLYLTHFGRVEDVTRLAGEMHERIDDFAVLATSAVGLGDKRYGLIKEGLTQLLLTDLRHHKCPLGKGEILELLGMDLDLNAQGLVVWLDRQAG